MGRCCGNIPLPDALASAATVAVRRPRIDPWHDAIEIRLIPVHGGAVNRIPSRSPSPRPRAARRALVAALVIALALCVGQPGVARLGAEAAVIDSEAAPVSRGGGRRAVDAPRPARHDEPTAAPHAGRAATARSSAQWTLAWSDEFDGPAGGAVDARYWNHETGDGCAVGICGWGNEEKQHYTSGTANAALTGSGMLAITARVAPEGLRCHYGPCRYTSAKLNTRGRVTPHFGRVEARIRLPTGQGLWPAFWMLGAGYPGTGWPDCGELDIMEHHGSKPGNISSAMHGPGYSGGGALVHAHAPPGTDFTRDFHRYRVEWDSTQVRFSVDDTVHYVVPRGEVEARGRWAFDHPFYIILNLAVGGTFDGDPATDAILPATMLVDYVRVYERR